MLHLPPPYPDELIYSTIARFFSYMQPRDRFKVCREYFGTTYLSVKYGHDLRQLADRCARTWRLNAAHLVENHTLLPFYGSYLDPKTFEECHAHIMGGSLAKARNLLGLGNSSIADPVNLRFCPICAAEDIRTFGETFWRRSHQMAGALVCFEHEEVLCESSAAYGTEAQRRIQNASDHIDLSCLQPVAEFTEEEFRTALEISRRCVDTLHGQVSRWNSAARTGLYRRFLNESEYAKGNSLLLSKELGEDIVSGYGPSFLEKLGLRIASPSRPFNRERQFGHISFPKKASRHPLVQILAQHHLERKAAVPVGIDPRDQFFRETEWKCPNPYAGHDDSHRVEYLEYRQRSGDNRYLFGKCGCGYAFVFKEAGSDPLKPVVLRASSYGPTFVAAAKRYYAKYQSMKNVADKMGLNPKVVERLIKHGRAAHDQNRKDIQERRASWLKWRSSADLQWLRKHDAEWIGHQPRRKAHRVTVRRGQYDEMKDRALANEVGAAVKVILALDPPERVTVKSIGAILSRRNLGSQLKRLPVSAALVASVWEPRRNWLGARSG